ncbi:hypothetical protein [Nitrosopumilus sp.]|uniref:hypothetical protein n=1 Tax=Nitrosopumilus sp. TaxID=2024843 RepID=UPI00247E3B1A|nr:hypothetical protein [Nitrosopumilus sp.]MCV0409610.1 hypothetical protein [Nitrosopumilus sp.]
MKTRLLITILLTVSILIPMTSFAQKPVNCYFGDDSVSLDDIFEKDMAVKAFTEKHPNAIRQVVIEQTDPLQGKISFTTDDNGKEEILLIKFNQNENGCYRPYPYIYSYDDGIIDGTVQYSVLDITEIINLIKLEDKKIEHFYAKNCNTIQLDAVLDGNSKPYFCKSDVNGSIEMHLQKHVGGTVEVHIKDKAMDALFYNCVIDGFMVLNNNEEISYELVVEEDKKIFKFEFLPGYNEAEIAGFSYGGGSGFCGSIWGDDSRYISPLLQTKIGVEPWMVKCNDDMTLLLKPTEFTTSACVTGETADKLSHRGWSIVLSQDEYSDW